MFIFERLLAYSKNPLGTLSLAVFGGVLWKCYHYSSGRYDSPATDRIECQCLEKVIVARFDDMSFSACEDAFYLLTRSWQMGKGLFGAKFKIVSSRSHPWIVEPNSLTLLGVHGRVQPAKLKRTWGRRVKNNAPLTIVIATLDQRQLPL